MAETVDKPEIFDQIQRTYAALEAGLAALTEGQMTAPALTGGWSVKDTLAHLTIWHRRALDLIDPVEPPRVPGIPMSGIQADQIDTFNRRFYEEHQADPLPAVLAAFRESYRQLEDVVWRLTDADLMKTVRDEVSFWQIIAGNTYEHYPEHLDTIKAAFKLA